jgi:exportin-7
VYNKGQRITFEQSSANGILLFREASSILVTYGSRILAVPCERDIYLEKYKGIRLMLNTLTCALVGNYVNFGVFELYGDKALQNALDVCLQTCFQIPISEVMQYVKLSKAYFAFLEVLFRNHLDIICGLESSVFMGLLLANQEGLQSSGKLINFIPHMNA